MQALSTLFSAEVLKKSFFLMSGPCVVENEEIVFQTATTIHAICEELNIPFIFKSSYRKANRTRTDSFRGIGDEKALNILGKVRKELKVPVVTDIHLPKEAALAAKFVDVLQIPAFLCRQTELLEAAGVTQKIINIKKGQFSSPESMAFAVEKVKATGNSKILLTERGTTFGYQDLIVDFRGIPIMKQTGCPVVMDCTHSLQQPNQSKGVTGGRPDLIGTMMLTGLAAGADGLFIETHPHPEKALSDGANMLPLDRLKELLERALKVYQAVHQQQ